MSSSPPLSTSSSLPPRRQPSLRLPSRSHFYLLSLGYALPVFVHSIWTPYINSHIFRRYVDDFLWTPEHVGRIESLSGMFSFILSLFLPVFFSKIFKLRNVLIISSCVVTGCFIVLFSEIEWVKNGLRDHGIIVVGVNGLMNVFPELMMSAYGTIAFRVKIPELRRLAMGFRNWAGSVGSVVGNGLMAFGWISLKKTIPFGSVLFVSSMAFVGYVIAPRMGMEEKKKEEGKSDGDEHDASDLLGVFWQSWSQNCAFRSLVRFFLWENMRGLLFFGTYNLYIIHVLDLRDPIRYDRWMAIYNFVPMIASIGVMPIWMWIRERYGLKRTFLINYLCQLVLGAFVFLIGFFSPDSRPFLYCIASAILTLFSQCMGYFIDGYKARIFDYDELLYDARRETQMQSFWTVVSKFISLPGSSFALWLASSLGGFAALQRPPDSSITPQQSNTTVWWINVQATLIPCLTGIPTLILIALFPIVDSHHGKILSELSSRKENVKPDRFVDPMDETSKSWRFLRSSNQLSLSSWISRRLFWISLCACVVFGGAAGAFEYQQSNAVLTTATFWLCCITLTASMALWKLAYPTKESRKVQ